MNIIKSRPTRRQVFSYMRRLIAYVAGMFFIASGVSLSRSTNWGISTVNSIPNVLSLRFPQLTLGTWVIIVFTCFILVQIIHQWGSESLQNPFAQSGDRDCEEKQSVHRRGGSEHDAAAHDEDRYSQRGHLAPAPRRETAEEHREYHRDAAAELKRSAGAHAAVGQREVERTGQFDQHHRHHHRTAGVSAETAEGGVVIPPELHSQVIRHDETPGKANFRAFPWWREPP